MLAQKQLPASPSNDPAGSRKGYFFEPGHDGKLKNYLFILTIDPGAEDFSLFSKKRKSIGLCMIVKDEASIILRCLESVRPLIDYVYIEDTGSTDGTQAIITKYLREQGIRGQVVDRRWKDFAANRSSALACLRQISETDYALIMDADDTLLFATDFNVDQFKSSLTADTYNITIRLGPVTYHRPQLCSNQLPFRYRGVLHEFLELPPPAQPTCADAIGLSILCGRDGARGQDPEKYQADAETLRNALKTEQDPLLRARYTFYLAQSCRDAGEGDEALSLYLQRSEMGFWQEEAYICLYEAARLTARRNTQVDRPDPSVVGLFLLACERSPQRAESLHGAMAYCRVHEFHHQGYLLGRYAVTLNRPSGGLFLEEWIYDYGLFDEFSVLAYWSGHFEECRDYTERILREAKIPQHERERIAANHRFAQEKLTSS